MFMLRLKILKRCSNNAATHIQKCLYLSWPFIYNYLYFKIKALELKPNFVWFNPVLRDADFQWALLLAASKKLPLQMP